MERHGGDGTVRPVRRTPATALAVVAAAVALLAGCARGLSRDQIRTGYRDELVRTGVPSAVATCVTDQLFAAMDDDELRAFQRRDRLTDDERAAVERYTDTCTRG